MTTELAVADETSQTLTRDNVHQQIQLIQDVMKNEMKINEHYGVVPGCGDKPTLLKAGAEKLSLLFKMAPRFKIENIDLGNGHREVRITTELYHITTGKFLGEGVGSCSTLESKYRWRSGEGEPTGEVVPKAYWKERDPELIGGKGFVARKIDGQWMICAKGEKVENPDIADTYNTVLKMGKKRSQVDAVLTATAASDIFTQDLEEMGQVASEKKANPAASAEPEPQASTQEDPNDVPPGFDDAPETVESQAQSASKPNPPKPAQKKPPEDRRRLQSFMTGKVCKVCKKAITKGEWIYKKSEGEGWVHEATC